MAENKYSEGWNRGFHEGYLEGTHDGHEKLLKEINKEFFELTLKEIDRSYWKGYNAAFKSYHKEIDRSYWKGYNAAFKTISEKMKEIENTYELDGGEVWYNLKDFVH